MTDPGVYRSAGTPLLEEPARAALRAAQERLSGFSLRPPVPMPREEREEALETAKDAVCAYCASWHPAPSSPACPRIAKCKMNADGTILEVEFWPEAVSTSAVETDGEGNVRAVTHHQTTGWDAGRALRVQDAAEEDGDEEENADGGH